MRPKPPQRLSAEIKSPLANPKNNSIFKSSLLAYMLTTHDNRLARKERTNQHIKITYQTSKDYRLSMTLYASIRARYLLVLFSPLN